MTVKPWVRRARPDDAPAVVDIIREAFPPWVVERTIYGCAGMTSYVAGSAVAGEIASPAFLVSGSSTDVLAATEIAINGRQLFVSYIGTRPEARSQGLGANLLSAATRISAAGAADEIVLDVFRDNVRARAWYARLGFASMGGERGWWEFGLPAAQGQIGSISGLAQAELCHRAFGFSEITVVTSDATYRIGRLGSCWFRVTDLSALADPALMATLAGLDPSRQVLAMGTMDDNVHRRLGAPVLRSLRLLAQVLPLQRQLADAVDRG
jgi:ribosomal protein S18 acetylase RimI-like enzyme